ncbi:MAG: IS200/IS605 family transposase [Defluviitaleaceae bacterium]|nr:IS200/IS605 family transposase [Defluviitaleaceae bacterium]
MPDKRTPVVTDIKYHFVWHTKFLAPILVGDVKIRAGEIISEGCKENELIKLEGRIGKNFVYIKVISPARLSPSAIMRLLKGRSSRYLQAMFPHIREANLHNSVWDSGFFCATCGNVSDEDIKNYIKQPPRGL